MTSAFHTRFSQASTKTDGSSLQGGPCRRDLVGPTLHELSRGRKVSGKGMQKWSPPSIFRGTTDFPQSATGRGGMSPDPARYPRHNERLVVSFGDGAVEATIVHMAAQGWQDEVRLS